MIRLSEKSIYFCGKERHFKKCPTKMLKDPNKDIRKIQKQISDIREEVEQLQKDANELRRESESIMAKEVITDEEREKSGMLMKESIKKEKAYKKAMDDFEKKAEELEPKLLVAYGKKCALLLDPFEEKEFSENYDSTDMALAPIIEAVYDMYMSNFPQAKIDQRIRQVIEKGHDNLFQ